MGKKKYKTKKTQIWTTQIVQTKKNKNTPLPQSILLFLFPSANLERSTAANEPVDTMNLSNIPILPHEILDKKKKEEEQKEMEAKELESIDQSSLKIMLFPSQVSRCIRV